MKTNSQIRALARESIRGNWNAGAVVVLLYIALATVGSYVVTVVASIFLGYPLQLGVLALFLLLARKGVRPAPENLFGAFNQTYYWKSIGVLLLTALYTILWSLLLIVPGIIKSYAYRQAPYILYDNPSLTTDEAIEQSMKMMRGHKLDLFLMDLGFWAWSLLAGIFTLGIAMLWVTPYYYTVYAKFYMELKRENEGGNTLETIELVNVSKAASVAE